MSGTDESTTDSGIHFSIPWTFAAALLGGGVGLGAGGTLTFAPQINQDSVAACYDISNQALEIAANANTVAADHGTEIERIRRNNDNAQRRLDLQSDDLRRVKAELAVLRLKLEAHDLNES